MKYSIVLLLVLLLPQGMVFAQDEPQPVRQLEVDVLAEITHEPDAFTQGLLWHEGMLYESTGQYGASSLRQVDPENGEVLLYVPLPEALFAEGLALAESYLFQITWREQVALRFNISAFVDEAELELEVFPYDGEGWGLCYDGEALYMSDGSDTLTLRDPITFEVLDTVQVTYEGVPLREMMLYNDVIMPIPEVVPTADSNRNPQRIDLLNELECVDGSVYANVWYTDKILQIDSDSGAVVAEINAAGLLTEEEATSADVLNGIAYLPESETFIITGKYWPKMFEVMFVPVASN